eukprot:CAMPEP_0195035850 /NCGR_PEP_ID=MMETSP0326_2-20130528/71186_1 /TAXON_ID=2866 ORGANISM="Crypthecodinium cohnii, Strain Seligo" /NCGR_SAMPLE_ID=MMETSP0326_2 /ASSEMBLY_ACC=CAM_ASM_000348 /LENGTH=78 /DNA_ID=CAMNT_0040061219 /DNA_START=156 /DNA_END=389 /DNA_ORIENTATION=-
MQKSTKRVMSVTQETTKPGLMGGRWIRGKMGVMVDGGVDALVDHSLERTAAANFACSKTSLLQAKRGVQSNNPTEREN